MAIVCSKFHVNSKHWHEEKHPNQAGRGKLFTGQTATQQEGKFPIWQYIEVTELIWTYVMVNLKQ